MLLQTGTGFIKMDPNAKSFAVMTESVTTGHLSCHGNPATNDWIPAPADNVCNRLTLIFFKLKFRESDPNWSELYAHVVSVSGGSYFRQAQQE